MIITAHATILLIASVMLLLCALQTQYRAVQEELDAALAAQLRNKFAGDTPYGRSAQPPPPKQPQQQQTESDAEATNRREEILRSRLEAERQAKRAAAAAAAAAARRNENIENELQKLKESLKRNK